jgi:hypothetical protein
MMKRLYHLFWGHTFKQQSVCFCNGTGQAPVNYTEGGFCVSWGFTQFVYVCECGKAKKFRAVGQHGATPGDRELAELREITGL